MCCLAKKLGVVFARRPLLPCVCRLDFQDLCVGVTCSLQKSTLGRYFCISRVFQRLLESFRKGFHHDNAWSMSAQRRSVEVNHDTVWNQVRAHADKNLAETVSLFENVELMNAKTTTAKKQHEKSQLQYLKQLNTMTRCEKPQYYSSISLQFKNCTHHLACTLNLIPKT